MRTNVKKAIITMAAVLAFATSGAAIATQSLQAQADAIVTNENIAVEESAALRIENFGLRFKTKVATDYWKDDMEVHTIMIPTSYLNGSELTTTAHAQVKDYTLDNAKKYEKGEDYYFNTVLTGIPQSQYGTEVSMRAYVKDGDAIAYAPNTVSVSVAQVANAALEYNFDAYVADMGKYLVKGINMSESVNVALSQTGKNLYASVEYFDEISDEVKAKLDEKYTLTYDSESENIVTVDEEGDLTILSSGSSVVTVALEELGISKTITVNVAKQPAYGEVFDFDTPVLDFVSVHKNSTLANSLATINENGKLQVFLDTNNTNYHIRFKMIDAMKMDFDWVKLSYSASYGSGASTNCMIQFNGAYMDNNTFSGATQNGTVQKSSANENWAKINDESEFRVVVQQWRAADTFTIVFNDIQFGYNDIEADNDENTTFNLLNRFSLTAQELTNVKFNGEAVVDVTAFAPTESGTLTFDVEKAGFAKGSFSINVAYTKLKSLSPAFDFENPSMSNVHYATCTASVGTDVTNGNYVEIRAKADWANLFLKSDSYTTAQLKKFDWFKITYQGWYEDSNGNKITATNFQMLPGNTGGTGNVGGDGSLRTYTVNRTTNTSFESMIATNNTSYDWRFTFRHWGTGLGYTQVVRIYNIEMGYNDITSDGATAINLTSKFNATEAQLSATFTPTGGNATAITSETAWTPAESGTLRVTIKKDGYKKVTYTLKVTV